MYSLAVIVISPYNVNTDTNLLLASCCLNNFKDILIVFEICIIRFALGPCMTCGVEASSQTHF